MQKPLGNKTCSEVEPVIVVITSNDTISNTSSPLLWSYALTKEGMITGTRMPFRHPPSTTVNDSGAPPHALVS